MLIVASVVLGAVALLVTGVVIRTSATHPTQQRMHPEARTTASSPVTDVATSGAETPPTVPSVASSSGGLPVEMPDVCGKPLSVAQALLTSAGFPVLLSGTMSTHDGREAVVIDQSPPAGTRVTPGEQVTLTTEAADSPMAKHFVVVLDPGHQTRADLRPEPVGPGARESKERVTAGSVGVDTHRSEAEVALEVAIRVRRHLEDAGVEVVLTRASNDVSLSNAERAQMANRAKAHLFVRLHADAVSDVKVRGVSVLYPSGNAWVSGIATPSRRAATLVETRTARACGIPGRGTSGRGDLAGFNWSRVPAILVEAGCLSNADDDRLLATAQYQEKLATGIADGILAYLGRR